eukprot:855681-Pelagomonas_calceolata.AAC.1
MIQEEALCLNASQYNIMHGSAFQLPLFHGEKEGKRDGTQGKTIKESTVSQCWASCAEGWRTI